MLEDLQRLDRDHQLRHTGGYHLGRRFFGERLSISADRAAQLRTLVHAVAELWRGLRHHDPRGPAIGHRDSHREESGLGFLGYDELAVLRRVNQVTFREE